MRTLVFLSFLYLPVLAQLEPCGFFEVNDVPGFGSQDLYYAATQWRTSEQETDFNSDGVTRVDDMVRMMNCVNGLTHGLAGSYYGFHTGDGSAITYPDFSSLPDPVVVRATERLDHEPHNYHPLLDSEMRNNSAAIFEGYLFVPDDSTYVFQIFGYRGIKLFIDDQLITGFESAWAISTPYRGEAFLTYGLHPIRIEYFTADHAGSIVVKWLQPGWSDFRVIDPEYLYHETVEVPTYANTGLECLFEPASCTRTVSQSLSLSAYFMGPDSDIRVFSDGQELVLQDGFWSVDLSLQPGLNEMDFLMIDSQGRSKEVTYYIYSDTENLNRNGLVATLYGEQFTAAPIPSIENLQPYTQLAVPGVQIDSPMVGSAYTSGGVLCHWNGALEIQQAGKYQFRISSTGLLKLNGKTICAIYGEYRGQWMRYGTIYLTPGNYHFHLETADAWHFPDSAVYWSLNEGEETLIPDSAFHHSDSYYQDVPVFGEPDDNYRVRSGLVSEYLLREGEYLRDSSGRNFSLEEDMRVIKQGNGGIDISIGGGYSSEQSGVHAAHEIVENQGMTFEAEFIWEGPTPNNWSTRKILTLMTPWGTRRAGLAIRNRYLVFFIEDDEDYQLDAELVMNNFTSLYQGQRVHVTGTWDGSTARLYVNGQFIDSITTECQIDQWEKVLWLSVGTPSILRTWSTPSTYDYSFHGKILMGAVYNRPLSSSEILYNYQTNQNIIAPPVEPDISRPAFPPSGTTQAELEEAHHILNRLTFGPDQASLESILSMGVDAWIQKQLNPDEIDDSKLEHFLSNKNLKQKTTNNGFIKEMLYRSVYSERQLQEVMTQFWENHFNTEMSKVHHPHAEWIENNLFRANALGNFKDLLVGSATHYPMTKYLDNIHNKVGSPNENYGREIFELHSFGANNNYIHEDIIQAARCFTGWTIREGKFYFNPVNHDYGEKYLPSLSLYIPPGGGMIDGLMVIDDIVSSHQTAYYIAWKLCQLFIDDDPPNYAVTPAARTFHETNGDINQVLNTIFNLQIFRTDQAYRRNKVKTPLEFVTSVMRVTESDPAFRGVYYYLDKMGMELFNYPFPTGFEEAGDFWVNTNSLLFRWNFVHLVTSNRGYSRSPGMNIADFINSRGLTTSDEVMSLLEGLTTHGRQQASVNSLLEDYLTNQDPGSFAVTPETIDQEIRHTFSLFMRLPEFNRQ